MSWTDDRIELLKKLWLEGWSASRIAAELGSPITRNAVIGKVYRLGLSGRAKPQSRDLPDAPAHQKPAPRPPSAARAPRFAGNAALALDSLEAELPLPEAPRDIVVPICEPVTIVELRESMCRWPIGDPAQSDFRFCGAKKLPGQGPYCACHSAIAFQTVQERRRDRR